MNYQKSELFLTNFNDTSVILYNWKVYIYIVFIDRGSVLKVAKSLLVYRIDDGDFSLVLSCNSSMISNSVSVSPSFQGGCHNLGGGGPTSLILSGC